jgi:hypothetical protein
MAEGRRLALHISVRYRESGHIKELDVGQETILFGPSTRFFTASTKLVCLK